MKKRNRRILSGKFRGTALDSLESRCLLSTTPATTLVATLPFGATDFVENTAGTTIYATVPTKGEVVVINEVKLTTTTISVGTRPQGLALSDDGSTLYVADNGSTNIDLINTANNTVETPLSLGGGNFPTDVQVGNNNRLWVLVGGTVMQIDATTGASTGASFNTQGGDIRITPDGNTLLAANYGSSPSQLDAWNVSGATAVQLYTTAPGSNGEDLELSSDGSTFVLASGGGNGGGAGYFDDTYATADGTAHSNVMVGAYPASFAFSQDGTLGYAGEDFQSPSIQIYSLTRDMSGVLTFGGSDGTITTANNPAKMFSATDGDLFVGEGSVTEVFGPAGTSGTTSTVPVITSISPATGPANGGTIVTITGSGFTGATDVQFGPNAATDYIIDSDTQITATSPEGIIGTVRVRVDTSGGRSMDSLADQFTYAATQNAPSSPGRTITITGPANQSAIAGTTKVFTLGSFSEIGATGPYTVDVSWGDGTSDTEFSEATTGLIPNESHVYTSVGTDTVSITITTSGVQSNTVSFSVGVTAAPSAWLVVVPAAKQTALAGVSKAFSMGSLVVNDTTSPYTLNVNWGDGSANTVFQMTGAGSIPAQSHTYSGAGTLKPRVTVTDANGVTYTASFGVSVTTPVVGATISAAPLRNSQSSYAFTVNYVGDLAIDTTTLGNHNIFVTGPNGYLQSARLISFTVSDHGKKVSAVYHLKSTHSAWSSSANGVYHVYIRAAQVLDTNGDAVAGSILGPFKVLI